MKFSCWEFQKKFCGSDNQEKYDGCKEKSRKEESCEKENELLQLRTEGKEESRKEKSEEVVLR